jgi:hypothetical protein
MLGCIRKLSVSHNRIEGIKNYNRWHRRDELILILDRWHRRDELHFSVVQTEFSLYLAQYRIRSTDAGDVVTAVGGPWTSRGGSDQLSLGM